MAEMITMTAKASRIDYQSFGALLYITKLGSDFVIYQKMLKADCCWSKLNVFPII